MDFDDLKAELNGQSAAETSAADRAELEQRMRAAGITPCSPMDAIKEIAREYDSQASQEGIEAIKAKLDALSPEDAKQALYTFGAAIVGVSNLRDALLSVVMVKALEGDEGYQNLLGGFGKGAM